MRRFCCSIAVVAAHTNLDSATGGLNDLMADALGMSATSPLVPDADDPAVGPGRVGDIAPTPLGVLAMRAVEAFSPRHANLGMAGDPGLSVTRVAVCTGSGRSLIDAARSAGADAYVTGDLTYHDADSAEGMGLVNVPHGAVEQHCMRAWAPVLADARAAIAFLCARSDIAASRVGLVGQSEGAAGAGRADPRMS